MIADDHTPGIDPDLKLDEIIQFSSKGEGLYIRLKKPELRDFTPKSSVAVWSYRDVVLQPSQKVKSQFLAFFEPNKHSILRLEYPGDDLRLGSNDDPEALLIKQSEGDVSEYYWNGGVSVKWTLSSATSNNRISIPIDAMFAFRYGDFVVGLDKAGHDVISYNYKSRKLQNLTEKLAIPQHEASISTPAGLTNRGLSIIGWVPKTKQLLIYDYYDIWLLDLSNAQPAECLTMKWGRRKGITFRLSGIYKLLGPPDENFIDLSSPLLLNAFDNKTKENGFYRLYLKPKLHLECLNMSDCVFEGLSLNMNKLPIVASINKKHFLLPENSISSSTNYFFTSDFKKLRPLSNFQPEEGYNGVRSKLINFTTTNGDSLQAIMYLPENFDRKKKYPVIFNYYENVSEMLNVFPRPNFIGSFVDIAWFVSRGYIVCRPDIKFKIGYAGESALKSVNGLADKLRDYSFIDINHIGLQGHSFSGFTTNYIISHSDRFKAAASGASLSDFVGLGSHIFEGFGSAALAINEVGQIRLGAPLWERPDLYIKNSPIFNVQRVNTPLLMMHNRGDGTVPFTQGLEMFLALRRLGKKAWLLQYDGAGHHVYGGINNSYDYTNRLTQFFDYYLKNAPVPKWMVEGIPAAMKGIVDGLDFMPEGMEPGPGLNNQVDLERQKKYLNKSIEELLKAEL